MFEITPPTRVTLIISVILAVVAAIVHFARIELPVFPTHGFAMLLVGYLVLLAGNLVRGMQGSLRECLMNCPHCHRPLSEIDYYGERLIGCLQAALASDGRELMTLPAGAYLKADFGLDCPW